MCNRKFNFVYMYYLKIYMEILSGAFENFSRAELGKRATCSPSLVQANGICDRGAISKGATVGKPKIKRREFALGSSSRCVRRMSHIRTEYLSISSHNGSAASRYPVLQGILSIGRYVYPNGIYPVTVQYRSVFLREDTKGSSAPPPNFGKTF